MIILYGFTVALPGGKSMTYHNLGIKDLLKLHDLFPLNVVWEGTGYYPKFETDWKFFNNIQRVTVDQMRALYDALVSYYVEHGVSAEAYQTSGFTHSFAVMSDLESVFLDLIGFCEAELGFTCTTAQKKAIAMKRQAREDRQICAAAEHSDKVLAVLARFKPLQPPPPGDGARAQLVLKIAEYEDRRDHGERWMYKHPALAWMTEEGYRDTVYKIAVVEAVLRATGEISLCEIARPLIADSRRKFDGSTFLEACAVIANYLGTPLQEAVVTG